MNLVKYFKRIELWKKFTCLGVLCLAILAIPTAMYWHETNKPLALLKKEQQGLQPIRLILNIIQRTQQHRATAARFLLDDSIPKTAQRVKAEELEEAIFSYETYLLKNLNTEHRQAFERIVDYWHNVHQKVSRKKINFAENYEMHKTLLNMQLDHVQVLIDHYKLAHDQSAARYLIDVSLMQLPELINTLARTRGYAIGLLIKGKATTDERAQLKAFILASDAKINAIDSAFRKLELIEPKTYASAYQHYQAVKIYYENTREITQQEIFSKEKFTYSRDDYYTIFTSAINGYYNCIYFSLDQINLSLTDRINHKKSEMYRALLYILFFILIGVIICIKFLRGLLQQLGGDPKQIAETIEAISRGDLDSDIESKNPQSLLENVKCMQEKLRDTDQAKSDYIATANHELNIPLSAISSTLSLAVSGQLGALPESAMAYLDTAQKDCVHLGELIDKFLDYNKLSISKLELDMQVQPLMPIIDGAKLSMASYAQKHGVHIVMGPRFEYLLVNVDSRRLRQVIKNLLSNAAKFSNKGEEIILNITVHVDKVRIDVIDRGYGISDELKEGLFQKYPQEIASESNPRNNAGLGLVISKKLVEAMGGEIGFSSTLGIGSCFYIDLPLEEPNTE
jgi:signal transduction histidine kinase